MSLPRPWPGIWVPICSCPPTKFADCGKSDPKAPRNEKSLHYPGNYDRLPETDPPTRMANCLTDRQADGEHGPPIEEAPRV